MEAMPIEVAMTPNDGTPSIKCLVEQHVSLVHHSQQYSSRSSIMEEFPLSSSQDVLLHILTSYGLKPQHLARLEATRSFFRLPSNLNPLYPELNIVEVAALDMCQKRAAFKLMEPEERESLKQCCGGSWKLVLMYLMTGEACYQREKCQAIAGPEHNIVVTSGGTVYSFGNNDSGELGHGTLENEYKPRLIRELQGIRIIQAAVGAKRTMLVSDAGRVYTFGKCTFSDFGGKSAEFAITPKVLESLKHIFVVQVTIGCYFTAVLSREGSVYTFSWGTDARLGHNHDPNDCEPRLLLGPWDRLPVVQIAAGNCYLLLLAFQPSGMSVYSLGCGAGGKLGHGTTKNGMYPLLIEHFQTLNLKPVCIAAGAWHAAVLGQDGWVRTWGWGHYGCLGHGDEDYSCVPKVVEALSTVKAVHIAMGTYTTFVVSEDGDVYSFGQNQFLNLGHIGQGDTAVMKPELATLIKQAIRNERVVQISTSGSTTDWTAHTLVLTDAGKLYAFGSGQKGQLGVQLSESVIARETPELVNIDLS